MTAPTPDNPYDDEGEFAPEKVSASASFHKWLARDMPSRNQCAWSTKNELEFLADLGKFAPTSPTWLPRVELLRRYRASLWQRTRWGTIDRVQVETALALMDRDGVR